MEKRTRNTSIFFISLMAGSPWGGSEELWFRTALLAARAGIRVGCAVYDWPGKRARMKELSDAGCPIYYFPNRGRSKKNLWQRLQNKLSKWRLRKMLSSLPVDQYHVVVVNQGAFEITTPEWKSFYKRLNRYVLLFHNYRENETFRPVRAAVIQQWISKARKNLFASQRIKEVLEERSGIRVPHAATLLNPVTIELPRHETPYPNLFNDGYRFTVLAALEVNRKAQDVLIKVLSAPQWKARNWTLHLYGEGKDRALLQKLIAAHDLEKKVFLEGQTSDVRKVLQETHLLLQLTRVDAMPLSVVEAMAMARPVVVSQIGDMPFWVKEGENGWVSPDASEKVINDTLEKAWSAKEQWPQLGLASFRFFRERFTESPEQKLLEELNGLLD